MWRLLWSSEIYPPGSGCEKVIAAPWRWTLNCGSDFFRSNFCRRGTFCRTHEKSSEEVRDRIMRTLNTGERSTEEVWLIVRVVCQGVEDAEEGCIEFVQ